MTLEEAIKRLGEILDLGHEDWGNADYAALKLGIEALKWLVEIRNRKPYFQNLILPGETED